MNRKVRILHYCLQTADAQESPVWCPLTFNNPDCVGKCTSTCAWFSIEDDLISKYGEPEVYAKTAYCKDHHIGEIVE